jgi:hypothetical protein
MAAAAAAIALPAVRILVPASALTGHFVRDEAMRIENA